MTRVDPLDSIELVFDTGPVVCLGGARALREAIVGAWHGRAVWVAAVRDEVMDMSHGRDFLATAAAVMSKNRWLGEAVEFHPVDESDLAPIRDHVRQLDEASRRRRGDNSTISPNAHAGEVQSILHAHRTQRGFASNDGGALEVARSRRVMAGTTVDLVRQLIAGGADAGKLASDLVTLQSRGFDPGEVVRGRNDLYPRNARRAK